MLVVTHRVLSPEAFARHGTLGFRAHSSSGTVYGPLRITVVIPTFNGGDRVCRLLDTLLTQTLAATEWTVLVVDNASTDGTPSRIASSPEVAELASRQVSVSVISEPDPGANNARIRGLLEARTDLVCVMDDDVEPSPDFLALGAQVLEQRCNVGALLPRIEPTYERAPPPAITRREHLFATNARSLGELPIRWKPGIYPFAPTVTAALFLRRGPLVSAIQARGRERMLPGRTGRDLACGEDIELGILLGRAGYESLYEPALRLRHHISARRFATEYFVRLIIGVVRSQLTLERIYLPNDDGPSRARVRALGSFFLSIAAGPFLVLRTDGLREWCFALASRFAKLLGPYRDLLDRAGAS